MAKRFLPSEDAPYNPLDKTNLGESVAEALLAQPLSDLPPTKKFVGAGIYAIYYFGSHSDYFPIVELGKEIDRDIPLYVGKAIPSGARKGNWGSDVPTGSVLYKRLCEHAESIRQANNLELNNFRCKYLLVDDIWIPLGEALLIQWFSPVWNRHIEGFGNHDPGRGRKGQEASLWDSFHPGRSWAAKLPPSGKDIVAVRSSLKEHFEHLSRKLRDKQK